MAGSQTVKSLVVKIGADIGQFSKGIGKVSKDLEKLSKKWDRAGQTLTNRVTKPILAVGAGLGAVAVAGMKGAAELEAYRNTLNTVLKDSEKAGRVMAWAVDFANKTPFETDSVVEATVRLSAYGMEAQKVLPDIGDMASVMNKDLMDAVEAVADAQTGELERLKEFGITKKMIVEQGNKVMRGVEIVNAKGQITNQEKFNEVLFSLMRERFKGGMELQAGSFSGLMSTLTGTFKTAVAQMMGITATGRPVLGGFFMKLKDKLKELTDLITKWQNDGTLDKWTRKISDFFSTLFEVLDESVLPVLKDLGGILKTALDWFSGLPPKTQEFILKALLLGAALGPVVSGIGSIIGMGADFTGLLSNVSKLAGKGAGGAAKGIDLFGASLKLLSSPTGWVLLAIGALAALCWWLKHTADEAEDDTLTYEGEDVDHLRRRNGKRYEKPVEIVGGGTGGVKIKGGVKEFATGGIVTKPTLGIFGEAGPEAVIPLGKGIVVNHQGTITVRGINNREELVAVVEYDLAKRLVQENRRMPNRTSLVPIG